MGERERCNFIETTKFYRVDGHLVNEPRSKHSESDEEIGYDLNKRIATSYMYTFGQTSIIHKFTSPFTSQLVCNSTYFIMCSTLNRSKKHSQNFPIQDIPPFIHRKLVKIDNHNKTSFTESLR